ncbi:hypothetical protein ANCDUO_04278 [Ancylostoma duodenale]|uniref:Protein kinase domain-containing protein n=2 Tax=Ancylostoma duodenale TaxID=51022 RepID=A0A0C2DRN7_9BILA|nr:hypothetical protein ANCDUO_04278 [Ancylostoma duodenale]
MTSDRIQKRMQTADGFGLDGGPPVGAMPPPGSRLAKYLGGNRSGGSSGLHLNANVPTFIPQFAQLGLGDMQQPPPGPKPSGSHSPFTPHRAPPTFHPSSASASNHADTLPPYQNTNGSFSYQGPVPHIGKFRPKGVGGNNVAQFVSPDVKMELVHRQLAMEARADPTVYPDLPQQVEHLNHLVPLEQINQHHATQSVYKAISVRDGFRISSPKQLQPLETWKKLNNVNVVQLRENTNGSFSYQGPVPHIGKFRPKGVGGNNVAQFVSPDVKMELVHRQLAMEARADPTVYPDLPQQVEHLNHLVPLEQINQHHATQSVYKAISVRDGFRISSPKQLQPLETWKKLNNVNVVQLREVIVNCKSFGDSSVVLVYDYHPLADSLKTRHFGRMLGSSFIDGITGAKISAQLPGHNSTQMQQGAGVVEWLLWSYVIQLSSALRAVHANGLASRCVDLSKILVHGKNKTVRDFQKHDLLFKILLSCGGVADLLAPDTQVQQLQMEDLHALGRVLLALATGNAFSARRDLVQQSMTYVTNHYSSDMKNLISFLLSSSPSGRKSINEIMPMIGARFYSQLETAQMRNDMLENELSKELENGRLFRILAKINTVVERPEFNLDPSWSETGDRFMIKLFRDYVFHQVTESGKPWMDMAHIVQCLNKLDAGVSEKVQLVSRDGNNLLIVSYGDLRR